MPEVTFLFPGQGAQAVGMGKDFAGKFASAARVYSEASRLLGWDVAKVCFEGPADELDRTSVCQPAILTTSWAILAAMEEAGAQSVKAATSAAGLSLGEYTALVAAEAIGVPEALRLVQRRGQLMEEACRQNPGAMASVLGLDDGIVEAICAQAREEGMVVAANFNSPGQVVISGVRSAVERASELARQHGAKRVMPLAVSGAFHSPLMASAAAGLEEALGRVTISPCKMTVIANVSAEPVTTPDEIRQGLARQVKSPVRWSQSMRRLVETGCRDFIEVGPGKVLTGLMKRIAPDVSVANISTAEMLVSRLQT